MNVIFFLKTVLPGELGIKSRLAPRGDGCAFLFPRSAGRL